MSYPFATGEEKKEDPSPFSPSSASAVGDDVKQFRQRIQGAIDRIPQKDDKLMKIYREVKDGKSNYLLMIVGPKWTAKTELALTLQETVENENHGYFLRGSFNNLGLIKPYSALFDAVGMFAQQVLARGDEEVKDIQKRALEALGADSYLLASAIPSLDPLLDNVSKQKNNKRKAYREAKRFLPVLASFFAAVVSKERPVVILLENIDLADGSSFEGLKNLVLDPQIPNGLVIVATCDSNVAPTSELSVLLREMEDRGGAAIRHITVGSMSESDTCAVVSAALECEPSDCASLCRLITKENSTITPMYLSLLLEYLMSSKLIFGTAMFGWSWDERGIRKALKLDPGRLEIQRQVGKMSKQSRTLLTTASCIGMNMDFAILSTIVGGDSHESLVIEVSSHTPFIHYERDQSEWAFWSEEVRESLYETIPEAERATKHWNIGKSLWKKAIADDCVEGNIFIILSQLCKGVDANTKEKERTAMASLCLLGGRRAAKLTVFNQALDLLQTGISLLSESNWRDEYDLMHALYSSAAEMALCKGSFDLAEGYIESVLRHASCLDDMIPAYCSQIMVLAATERANTAIDTGIEVLGKIGIKIPLRPRKSIILRESIKVKRLLRGKSHEQILRIPTMTNLQMINAMRILTLVQTHTIMCRVEMHSLICIKMMQLTLQHGHSVMSSMAFAAYAVHQVSEGNIAESQRFADLSLKIHQQYGALEYYPRVLLSCNALVYPWKKPFELCLQPLLESRRIGNQTGDLETASLASNVYCCLSFEAGTRLDVLLDKWTSFQEDMIFSRQDPFYSMSLAAVQTIRHIMGLTEDPLNPKGDIYDFDEAAAITLRTGAIKAHVSLRMWQMRVAYMFNDYQLASKCAVLLDDFFRMPTAFLVPCFLFTGALVCLEAVREGRDKKANQKMVKKILGRFRNWSLVSPENYSGQRFLIEAELASLEGRVDQAYENFFCAIALLRDQPAYHALGNERLGRHLLAFGETEKAMSFLSTSVASYEEWGAGGKAKHLAREFGLGKS